MSIARKQKTEKPAAPAENLQARYKPIGLRAVVAATQCRKDADKARTERRERALPAGLHHLYD